MIDKFIDKIQAIGKLGKNKSSAVFITDFLTSEDELVFNTIKESNNHIYGYCEINNIEFIKILLKKIDGILDYIILDINIYRKIQKDTVAKQSKVFIYNDEKCWSDSIVSLLYNFRAKYSFSKVLIGGNSALTHRIINDVCDISDQVSSLSHIPHPHVTFITKDDLSLQTFDLVISTDYKQVCFDDTYRGLIDYRTFIIDAGIHGFSKNFIQKHSDLDSTIIRMDNRAALSSILTSILESYDLCENVMGEFIYEGSRVVAGGIMGMENDVIVDNIFNPTVVIGIASGDGKTLYNVDENSNVKIIKKLIKGQR